MAKSGKKLGFRMPANKAALDLISVSGVPIIAPSANTSGKKPPTIVREILESLNGKIDVVFDAGRTKFGIESTVIDVTVDPPVILREGAISSKKIMKALALK